MQSLGPTITPEIDSALGMVPNKGLCREVTLTFPFTPANRNAPLKIICIFR